MTWQRGERIPDFVLPGPDGVPTRFYGRAGGRPSALVFLGSAAAASATTWAQLVLALQARPDLAAYWIAQEPSRLPEGSQGWVDSDGALAARLGAEGDCVFVLDANLRLVEACQGDGRNDRVLSLLDGCLAGPEAPLISAQAPVLIVPRVVDDATCAALIARCRAAATETGVETYRSGESVDPVLKRRRDVTITDPEQLRALTGAVGRRLMPEVQRAFAFRATRFEGFKVACYDTDSGGFFAAHRDNLTVATAHRVFGLSINLNDDYDGGELTFPEFGRHRYRAPAGAAMVFSSALLHAVQPVIRGSRFVLLSFLYADAPA